MPPGQQPLGRFPAQELPADKKSQNLPSEDLGQPRVVKRALPLEDVATMDIDALIDDAGFSMRFAANVLPLKLDLGMIPPLLKSARRIYDMDGAPDRKEKCVDCQKVDELVRLAG